MLSRRRSLGTVSEGASWSLLNGVLQQIADLSKHRVVRLYRGMGAPLVGVTPIFALSFWSYDLGKKLATSFLPPATPTLTAAGEVSKELTLPQLAFAGFFSAIPTTLVTGPAERVKVLLQVRWC